MRRIIFCFFCLMTLFINDIVAQSYSEGQICDGNGNCVFTVSHEKTYKTQNAINLENQAKGIARKKINDEVCEVTCWKEGDQFNKRYVTLNSHFDPIKVRDDYGKEVVRFQYVGKDNDGAVEAFNDVIFVDHDFTVYLIMPEHYCHGLPSSPTQYKICSYCGKTYKIQDFFNSYTKESMSIYIGAGNCESSTTGNCDNLNLVAVPYCPKLDQPDCDKSNSNDIND